MLGSTLLLETWSFGFERRPTIGLQLVENDDRIVVILGAQRAPGSFRCAGVRDDRRTYVLRA